MALVYVIEDDDSLREILVESLVQAGLHTWGFASVDGAVEGLSQQVPDFLITDLDLGERSGLAMLEELDRHGLAIPTLLISGYLQEFGPHIPQRQGLELLAKPFDLQVLIEHVYGVLQFIPAEVDAVLEDVLEPGPMAQGFPSESEGAAPFGLFDYLQLACVGGHTVEINVFDPSDASNLIGRVLVLGGELWSTQDAQGMGSDAFLRLASVSGLIVTCNAMLQTSLARNIHCAWDALLLRAATLQDDVQERMQRGFDGDTPQAVAARPSRAPHVYRAAAGVCNGIAPDSQALSGTDARTESGRGAATPGAHRAGRVGARRQRGGGQRGLGPGLGPPRTGHGSVPRTSGNFASCHALASRGLAKAVGRPVCLGHE